MVINFNRVFISFIMALCFSWQGAFAITNENFKVLIYMQADNNLASYALWDLAELEKGMHHAIGGKVFIELDLPGNEGSFRLEVKKGNQQISEDLRHYESMSLRDFQSQIITIQDEEIDQKERLLNFLVWANTMHPTEKTLLIIWGHGEGYSLTELAQFGGIALDDNPHSRLSVKDLKSILQEQLNLTNTPINFLSLDACLMQTVEVALEFTHLSDYLSGSSNIQNFKGFDYTLFLKELSNSFATHTDPLYHFALALPHVMQNDFDQEATMSVVHTHELKNIFTSSFNSYLEKLYTELVEDPLLLMKLRSKWLSLPFFLGNSRDLKLFLAATQSVLRESGHLALARETNFVMMALDRAVLSYSYGPHFINLDHYYLGQFRAFSFWLPQSARDYQLRKNNFGGSRFFKLVPAWPKILTQLFDFSIF
jgi:hypothetical protein